MKLPLALLSTFAFILSSDAQEPRGKRRAPSTVPGPYPSIIKIAPPGEQGQKAPSGIIQSELGGREMQFFQAANRAGQANLALAELAHGRNNSEQVKTVADALTRTQVTENKEIARLAAEKRVALDGASGKALAGEIAALSGAKFEKAWIEALIAVSELGTTAYEVGAKSEDAAIRSFAEKMLPLAQARLQMASRLGGRSIAAKPAPAAPVESETPTKPPVGRAKP